VAFYFWLTAFKRANLKTCVTVKDFRAMQSIKRFGGILTR
jgi:hypothetical protein